MDSSNSGSFQSSSGGAGDNDEYDSRNPSISSFFNPPTTTTNHFNNPSSANLNQLLQPPPSYHNHHLPPPTHNTFFNNPCSSWPTGPITNIIQNQLVDTVHHTKPTRGSDHHQIGVSIKNPKKRTRASRRAPTTVLTTDTTNFRQMVQEFTGIPTAPFSRRLDLFAPTASLSLNNPLPPKVQPFLNSTANIVESAAGATNNTTTTSGNYHFAPSTINDFHKQPSSFLDLQNPMFSFQPLLQNSIPQQSNDLSGMQTSSKRWRDQNGKLEGFEGLIGNTQNIGGSKLNSGVENVLVSSRSGGGGGDQVQGNEGSWICPSN